LYPSGKLLIFSLTSSPFTAVTQATIPQDSNSVSFYYKDNTAGAHTITAAETPSQDWTDATQSMTILTYSGSSTPEDMDDWDYKATVEIDNSSGSALTDYQVLVTIDTQSLVSDEKMNSDGSDIRFLDSDDSTQLPYWIESGMNSTSTRIWVKIPSIDAASTKDIYLYYGNPSAEAASSMDYTMVMACSGHSSTHNLHCMQKPTQIGSTTHLCG